jgi:pyrophosphatase PpaX
MEKMADLEGVIFDLDGTLVDSRAADLGALAKALESLTGEQTSAERLWPFFGVSSEEAARTLVGEQADDLLSLWADQYRKDIEEGLRVYPGVKRTLAKLRAEGLQMAVVTLQTRAEMDLTRRYARLDAWIDVWVALDDVRQPKPHPDPLLHVLSAFDLEARRVVMIGDSVSDMRAGRAAGVRLGAALWGSLEADEILAFKPEFVFRLPDEMTTLCIQTGKT